MSKKVVSLTPEQRAEKEKQKENEQLQAFMKGRPNREEVANYVNSLLEQHYMPEILRQIGIAQKSMQLGLMSLQAILINKGICNGEEIKQVTEEYVKKFNEDFKKQQEQEQAEAEKEQADEQLNKETEKVD